MPVSMRRGFWMLFGGLTLILCQGVLPWGPLAQGFSSGMTIVIMALAWRVCGRQKRTISAGHRQLMAALPAACCAPIILVCGSCTDLDRLFGFSLVRETPQGCYLRLGAAKDLALFTTGLLARHPAWARQLAVMFCLLPEVHTDCGRLRVLLRGWHHDMGGLSRIAGHTLPAMVCLFLNGRESPWFICRPGGSLAIGGEQNVSEPTLKDWLRSENDRLRTLRWSQAIEAEVLLSWYRDELMPEKPGTPQASLSRSRVDLAVRFTSLSVFSGNVWQKYIAARTILRPMPLSVAGENPLPLPDELLSAAVRPHVATSGQRALARGMALATGYCLVTLCIVAWNNQRLLTRVAADLQRYHSIAISRFDAKAAALAVLVNDARELERYHRQGVPLRLGLGLYPGPRLHTGLLAAIDGYVPPVSEVRQADAPQFHPINLDSLSLFDTGSASLKPDSFKVLVAALMDIKAQPGWLIVIAGHADDTGNPRRNQALSLARAEAVRDWMRSMGNIPSGCFAVQGHGADRPLTGNDTATGRAANRRVDIRLIPEPGACQPASTVRAQPLRQ